MLWTLPLMLVGGVLGSLLDARRNKRISEKDAKDWEAWRLRYLELATQAVKRGNPVIFDRAPKIEGVKTEDAVRPLDLD